jgi:hypothetical protein
MRQVFRSNWNTVFLGIAGWAVILAVGYSKFGFAQNIIIGLVGVIASVLWLMRDRHIIYLAIEDNRWLINSEEKLVPSEFKLDIASILYIARFPHFIFHSWGGRMVIFFRDNDGQIKQIGIPEVSYSWDCLRALIKKLIAIKPAIEIDPQYKLLISNKEISSAELSQQLPRSVEEIDAYIAKKYGSPGIK